MNIIAIIFLSITAVIGIVCFIGAASPQTHYDYSKREDVNTGWQWLKGLENGAFALAIALAVVLAVWSLQVHVFSPYSHNTCRNEADGYGLQEDWSIRNGCRVYLPSGQLVPLSDIRITSDGDIIEGDT